MKEEDCCKGCKGKKIVENIKDLEVPVDPGVPHEYSYKFTGEADEAVFFFIFFFLVYILF
jgi:DnaJ-class molecular chaperone